MGDIGLKDTLMLVASQAVNIFTYIWFALCLYIIAKKTSTPIPWLAWIPVANIYLMCKVAGKPGWWTAIFCFLFILIIPGLIALVSLPFLLLGMMLGGGADFPSWFFPAIAVAIPAGLAELALTVIIWMGIARARNQPSWLGILIVVPMASLIIPGILAFSDKPSPVQNPVTL
jgi:hypothetical protein